MPPLTERLRGRVGREKGIESPLLNVRTEVRDEVRRQMQTLSAEIMAEMRRLLEEKIGEEGITTLKGDPGYTPVKDVDYRDGKDAEPAYTPQPDIDYPSLPFVKSLIKETTAKELRGKKGKDGSPDTPDRVVEKVNKSKKKIKPEQIEGLIDNYQAISRKKGGGGGGMGEPQHEQKSVNSSTTTFTTTHPIAAKGRAAWFYYQGQNLLWGTHYTVSASDRKTITLTFTPSDDTFIDCTYIRG